MVQQITASKIPMKYSTSNNLVKLNSMMFMNGGFIVGLLYYSPLLT